MRISELAAEADVSIATIKFYLREGLLPEGERSSATQATYRADHLERLRLIRALIGSGVSISQARSVLDAIDRPPTNAYDLLGTAHAATMTRTAEAVDTAEAEKLVRRLGSADGRCDDVVLGAIARALGQIEEAAFQVADDVMTAYLDAMRRIARAEIAGVPTDSTEAAVKYVVLGTILVEPLLLALRRAAEQIAAAERFGTH